MEKRMKREEEERLAEVERRQREEEERRRIEEEERRAAEEERRREEEKQRKKEKEKASLVDVLTGCMLMMSPLILRPSVNSPRRRVAFSPRSRRRSSVRLSCGSKLCSRQACKSRVCSSTVTHQNTRRSSTTTARRRRARPAPQAVAFLAPAMLLRSAKRNLSPPNPPLLPLNLQQRRPRRMMPRMTGRPVVTKRTRRRMV